MATAAEYDNYRKRTAKEKESLWTDAKADTVQAFLPVYDNLERALKQDTADEAYKKGVEMTMNQLKEVFALPEAPVPPGSPPRAFPGQGALSFLSSYSQLMLLRISLLCYSCSSGAGSSLPNIRVKLSAK